MNVSALEVFLVGSGSSAGTPYIRCLLDQEKTCHVRLPLFGGLKYRLVQMQPKMFSVKIEEGIPHA